MTWTQPAHGCFSSQTGSYGASQQGFQALLLPIFAEAALDMALRRRVLHAPDAAGSFVLDSVEAIESDQQLTWFSTEIVQVSPPVPPSPVSTSSSPLRVSFPP